MTDEVKETLSHWATEFIKNVGFPIAVSSVVLFFGYQQMQTTEARTEKMTDFALTTMKSLVESNVTALNGTTTALSAVERVVDENNQTRVAAMSLLERINEDMDRRERERP